ncbi:hypothetical protein G3A39_44150 [Paraburkholderia aspalathi]|nr:hypothetical protein [Paraburkholderia aspalathi]
MSPKIPRGTLSYAILYEDPTSVYCFEHDGLMESRELREHVSGPINYGHSSLGYKPNSNEKALFDRSLPKHKRLELAAKPVLLAGHVKFIGEDSPLMGAGKMTSWTVESGHYRPSVTNAMNNRIGFIKNILPIERFVNVFG